MRMRSCLNASGILLVKHLALGGMDCAVVAELEKHYQVPCSGYCCSGRRRCVACSR